MGVDSQNLDKTVFDAIVNEEPMSIHRGIHGMDLAPCNINLSAAEIQLVNMDFREVRLKDAIAPIQDNYDFILIDCPPSLGLLSYISLVAANHVLVPVETHYKAFEGTNLLLPTVARIRKKGNRSLQIAGESSLPLCCYQLSGQADSQGYERAVYDLWPRLRSHPAHNCFGGCFRKTSPACCLRT